MRPRGARGRVCCIVSLKLSNMITYYSGNPLTKMQCEARIRSWTGNLYGSPSAHLNGVLPAAADARCRRTSWQGQRGRLREKPR
jgi:hypothetical protein